MKKIVFIPNLSKDPHGSCSCKAVSLLVKKGFLVAAEPSLKTLLPESVALDGDELYHEATAIVVLGGDGSILRAAEEAAKHDIPILAVNLGRLGYIAQLEETDLNRLPEILSSDFQTESRAMLEVSLTRGKELLFQNRTALNDAVISKAAGHGMIEFSLFCNDEKVSQYRADGVIVSTATGSTAYAMSAGGAVIDPSLRIMEVTPICAHSLKARPIVFSERSVLSLLIHESSGPACVTLDGERTTLLESGDRLRIALSDKETKLIAVEGGFCHILNHKMSDL